MLSFIILLLAIPTGFLIAWLARDELTMGRKWFRALVILSFLAGLWFYITGVYHVAWTSAFILVVSIISYMKSFDGKWTKKRLK